MKIQSTSFFTTATLTAALIVPSFALEAPADDAPPPPAVNSTAGADATPDAQPQFKPLRFGNAPAPAPAPQVPAAKDIAFLGIVTSDVPEILAEHLKLTDGQGILVRSLMPDGPAAKAGISTNDIILRLADQPIGTPEDLSDSVSKRSPNDIVTVELIHKGEVKTIEITLAKRPQHFAAAHSQAQGDFNFDQLPKDLADRIRGALEGDLGLGDGTGAIPESMRDTMQDLQQRMQGHMEQAPGPGKIQVQSGAILRFKDQNGCIEVKSNEGNKQVTLRDFNGEVVWTGPWNTEQDKAAAPEDFRERIEAMNLKDGPDGNAGFQLQIPQAAAPLLGDP